MNETDGPDGGGVGYFSDAQEPDGSELIKCEQCGTSLHDLYKDGRMGCADCYVTFKSQVHRALIVLHGAYAHIGKSINNASGY